MKLRTSMQLIVGITFFLVIGSTCYSQVNHRLVEVQKAIPGKRHFVEIPGSFSHEKIAESNLLKGLQSKKIKRIELIYTSYKENENFDQNKLNEDRMFRLYQLLPKLQIDQPEIIWIEQTGATTREEAKNYFHGFRIYTEIEDKQAFKRLQREDSGNAFEDFIIDNSTGGVFSAASGTQIHIPANAVTDADGKLVIGRYTISYREYRNAAEMAFSGIPMIFHDKTGEYLFNSAGMYEIRGMKDGQPLELQKAIIVDFNCTNNEAGVNFYQMDDQTGEWSLLKSDLFAPETSSAQVTNVGSASSVVSARSNVPRDTPRPDYEGFSPENQYLNLAEGLRSEKFGVYNCDQIYRVANKISISPKYQDALSKKTIKETGVLCVIDKEVNASFYFSPQNITCNSKGKNVFLFFTDKGEVFAFQTNGTSGEQILKAKNPEFLMENITDKVKTSDDLKKYLAI